MPEGLKMEDFTKEYSDNNVDIVYFTNRPKDEFRYKFVNHMKE